MIADTAVLSTSPWQHDLQFRISDLPAFDLDLDGVDKNDERPKHLSDFGVDTRWLSSLGHTSCGTSVASSDCSDEPHVDIEADIPEEPVPLFGISEESITTGSLLGSLDMAMSDPSLSSFAWSDSELDYVGSMVDIDTTPSRTNPELRSVASSSSAHRRRKSYDPLHDTKNWAQMTSDEQVSTIGELTRVISNDMGLQEQLEVINMISPGARVLPTDTEFVIDMESMSDEKLAQVRAYVHRHTSSGYSSSSSVVSGSESTSSLFSSTTSQQKKMAQKQRRRETRQSRQRQRKEHRQIMKEKRSGLFSTEEVLSVSNCDPDEAEDIDILM